MDPESFVVGVENGEAWTAAVAACQDAAAVNPLLVWGGPGTGKTHLLHAVAARLRRERSEVRVVGLEEAAGDFVDRIRRCRLLPRDWFGGVEAIVLDDVHLAAGSLNFQEMLAAHIRRLCERGMPAILAATGPPAALATLVSHLATIGTFVSVYLRPPGPVLMSELLGRQATTRQLVVPGQVIDLLAQALPADGRAATWAMAELEFRSVVWREPISDGLARSLLRSRSILAA